MPDRLRSTITEEDKATFAPKLADIVDESGILDFLPVSSTLKAKKGENFLLILKDYKF